ncbi:MAG: GGDEF domain-containing protein [Anaerolineales bacterium]|nr:GGDEF domain-containing protein [Anaerolineales bacterium]
MSLKMQDNDSTHGLALMCNQDGVIISVVHDGLGSVESELLGKPFPLLVTSSSFQKALSFLVELRDKRAVFDWEFDLSIGSELILAHCAGLAIEDNLLILAAQTRTAVDHLFEEMVRINNSQTNHLRTITKEQVEFMRTQPEREIGLYEELSRSNNTLVTLQRELAKKNVELERLNAEVQRLALVDELTHLYNRRGFFEIGHHEVERAKRFEKPLSAIMLDIDNFKQFNDSYGHATGDKVIEGVATCCSRQLRKMDIFGRYGGEEFSVLLPETPLAGARIIAERLRHQTSQESISTKHGLLSVTISLGIAVFEGSTMRLEELLEHADQALYKAKESGRNRVCVDGE